MNTRYKTHRRITIFMCLAAVSMIWFTVSCSKHPQVARKIVVLQPDGIKKSRKEPEVTQLQRWEKLVQENRHASIEQKLVAVNQFFNSFDYVEDRFLWGRDDFWATLPETLKKSGGDCEDVSIAKFFTLLQLNIPDDSMRITYVISLKTSEPHMVLTFSPDLSQEPIVLDSLNNYLFPVSKRSDLVPVYSFNTDGYWLARKKEGWKGKRLGSAEKLSMWRSVLHRMRQGERAFSGV